MSLNYMLDTINPTLVQLRTQVRRKEMSSTRPAACWSGKDLLMDKPVPSLTIILRTIGCRFAQHGGCTMCGYINDAARVPPTEEELIAQFNFALTKAPDSDFIVKIFTSGSFFDTTEVPYNVQDYIFKCLQRNKHVKKVLVETRPVFVNDQDGKNLQHAKMHFNKPLEIAIGLETASDTIRSFCINKIFSFNEFKKACIIADNENITVKAYLLLKPPFLSEGDAIRDVISSARAAAEYAQTISINPCNIQKGTLVERLYHRREYRPPYLWSIIEVLKTAKAENPQTTIVSDPVAAGTRRGPYNCPKCNREAAQLINDFSLTQATELFEKFECECRYLWEKVVQLEDYAYGAQL